MTESTTTQQEPESTPEPDAVDQMDDVAALRKEAAGRRRALRETEAQRAQVEAQRNGAERKLVKYLAKDRLADPSDWTDGLDLDTLRGENGEISEDRIDEVLADVVTAKPHWGRKADEPRPSTEPAPTHQGVRPQPPADRSVGDALRSSIGRR